MKPQKFNWCFICDRKIIVGGYQWLIYPPPRTKKFHLGRRPSFVRHQLRCRCAKAIQFSSAVLDLFLACPAIVCRARNKTATMKNGFQSSPTQIFAQCDLDREPNDQNNPTGMTLTAGGLAAHTVHERQKAWKPVVNVNAHQRIPNPRVMQEEEENEERKVGRTLFPRLPARRARLLSLSRSRH